MEAKEIEYSTIKHAVSILAVMCAAQPEKIVDLLTGYLWDEEEAGRIKNASDNYQLRSTQDKMELPRKKEVTDMVKAYLKDNGYDGLYREECGCLIEDLAPCTDGPSHDCMGGYKIDGCNGSCRMGCEFHVVGEKQEEQTDDSR